MKNEIYKHMTSISKNVCIDKLDEIVNKYNNTQWNTTIHNHSTVKMKTADVKNSTHVDLGIKVMIKILNLKLVIM